MTRVEEDDAIKGAVLISAKPGSWIAGANIKMLEALESGAAAEEGAGIGQKGMDRIAALQKKKPWVAAIDGALARLPPSALPPLRPVAPPGVVVGVSTLGGSRLQSALAPGCVGERGGGGGGQGTGN